MSPPPAPYIIEPFRATTLSLGRPLPDRLLVFMLQELGIGNTKPEGGSGSQAQILQALKESELGLPVIVHQSFDKHP